MKQYYGNPDKHSITVSEFRHPENGEEPQEIRRYELDPRFDLGNHSPTGLSWGYAGSGPAQLALALASDVLGRSPEGDRLALSLYDQIKWRIVAKQPIDEPFEISDRYLIKTIAKIQKERGAPVADG